LDVFGWLVSRLGGREVRLWHKADIGYRAADICFLTHSGLPDRQELV